MKDLTNKAGDGTRFGQSSADLIGFYGLSAAVAQPQLSAFPAVATTILVASSISSSCFGFTSAGAMAILVLINGLRAQQVTLGLGAT
jgi:hypothetical protein